MKTQINKKVRIKRTTKAKKLNKTKKLNKLNCSPKPKDEINKFSCYSDKSLYKLREVWNIKHPDDQIPTTTPKEIHKALSNKMKTVCNKESCWIKNNIGIGSINEDVDNSFAPEAPASWKKNKNEWLSSIDILKVMKQYEKAYKCFDFIGPSPIDFDTKQLYGECVWNELCNFSLTEQIANNKTKIGIIFNTDPHYKGGEHWMSLFINIKKRKIFFFDSAGNEAPPEVKALINRIETQGERMIPPIKFNIDSNEGINHQYENTECGVYSLYFIVHMLEDKVTGHYLKTHKIKDEYMSKFRKVYFNESL